MCAPTLSVIIPVYNEGRYIKECIDSIITNGSVHFEIVVSDNCSTDDTLQKLDEYRDVRLKVHRFNESVSPHVNLFNCINKSQGKYIYFIGGDDYFVPGVLDEVIPLLNGSSVVAPFVTFDDKTNSEIAVRNNKDEFDLFFSNCDSFLNKILCNVNHDTLFHSFILRDDLLGCEKIMRSSMESLQIWLLLFIFNGRTSVMYFPDVVFYKRYNKRDDSVGYVQSSNTGIYGTHTFRSFGSLLNTFLYLFMKKDSKGALSLLLSKRCVSGAKNTKYHIFKRECVSAPVFHFWISPIIDVVRSLRDFMLKK